MILIETKEGAVILSRPVLIETLKFTICFYTLYGGMWPSLVDILAHDTAVRRPVLDAFIEGNGHDLIAKYYHYTNE